MIGLLQVIRGADIGRSFPLESGRTLMIGRAQNSGTQLEGLLVSRLDCGVRVAGDQPRLVDDRCVAGSFVNGHRVTEHDEFEGSVLKMPAKRPEDRFQTPTELEQAAKYNDFSV